MNIYIHVEVAARELDSKLLLAVLAASKGHQVILINEIIDGLKMKVLAPGIYHTKSLNPIGDKINRHQKLIDNGFAITSIDEEGGLVDYGYETFAKRRYSEETVKQASAIFGWGDEDSEVLKQTYAKYSKKIHKTGSPRADLWKPFFSDYWETPKEKPKKPFLLISSNLATGNNINGLHKIVSFQQSKGYYNREPELFGKHFGFAAENNLMIFAYVKAAQHLSNNKNYDIVLRPHLNENMEAWKIYLKGIPNVHVIREGPIDVWVKHAFAVMHNGCTTAFEAIVSEKPVISYVPFEQKYSRELANDIGHRIETDDQLIKRVNSIFDEFKLGKQKSKDNHITSKLSNKIYLDKNELAAEKIIKVWESLNDKSLCKFNNWMKFYWLLKVISFRRVIGKIVKKFFPNKFNSKKENHKFPPLDKKDIIARVSRLQRILGIEKKLECKLLSERTILVKL